MDPSLLTYPSDPSHVLDMLASADSAGEQIDALVKMLSEKCSTGVSAVSLEEVSFLVLHMLPSLYVSVCLDQMRSRVEWQAWKYISVLCHHKWCMRYATSYIYTGTRTALEALKGSIEG